MSQNASETTLRIRAPSKTSPKVIRRSMSKMSNGRTTLEYGQNASKRDSLCELHENAKRRVPNNMTKVCVTNSKNYVMCSERGKSRRAMMNKRLSTKQSGEENDSKRPKWRETRWLKMLGRVCTTMALNAKTKERWWLEIEQNSTQSNKTMTDRYRCGPGSNWTRKVIGTWSIDIGAASKL